MIWLKNKTGILFSKLVCHFDVGYHNKKYPHYVNNCVVKLFNSLVYMYTSTQQWMIINEDSIIEKLLIWKVLERENSVWSTVRHLHKKILAKAKKISWSIEKLSVNF